MGGAWTLRGRSARPGPVRRGREGAETQRPEIRKTQRRQDGTARRGKAGKGHRRIGRLSCSRFQPGPRRSRAAHVHPPPRSASLRGPPAHEHALAHDHERGDERSRSLVRSRARARTRARVQTAALFAGATCEDGRRSTRPAGKGPGKACMRPCTLRGFTISAPGLSLRLCVSVRSRPPRLHPFLPRSRGCHPVLRSRARARTGARVGAGDPAREHEPKTKRAPVTLAITGARRRAGDGLCPSAATSGSSAARGCRRG